MTEQQKLFTYTDPNHTRLIVTDNNPVTKNWLILSTDSEDDATRLDLARAAVFDLYAHLGNWLGKNSAEIAGMSAERDELREFKEAAQQEIRDLRVRMSDRADEIDELKGERNALAEEVARLTDSNAELTAHQARQRDEVKQLRKQTEKLQDKAEKLEHLGTELTGQIEELSLSPLDLAQQQRVTALLKAREVVQETSSSNVFSKSGTKVSLAGVVSTAHFITSGERDYVTTEGEYVLDSDRRPADDGMPVVRELLAEARLARETFDRVAWKSGVEDVADWIEDNLVPDQTIYAKRPGVFWSGTERLAMEIKDHFADPAVYNGDEPKEEN